ncbi:Protein of unknown function (DUF3347) [Galbibacter orientalis DSM 19592]|uniref:DUF3347 domain-containing protein n=1 Tax=Galbibacter orientalis DSM 19592 TaxID=926559 RepID=I3C0X7_9FLAO|nr:DUF3347 domain-containing protein [Galbibacter orientalis]EIJ37270.1 Protein of unknown function (DUF3347) [Galbibacter orientalis DSM 19592]
MKKMRIIPQIGILVAIGIFVISCKDSNSKSSETKTVAIAFKNDLADKAFQHYTHIKTALTNGNVSEAKKGGKMLSETISNNYIDISNLSKKIAVSENLEEQRQAFSELTNAIQPFIESNLENGEIYKQYCPMAFNNAGGYWFSKEEAVSNPYFGEKMLKCGTVKEVIK